MGTVILALLKTSAAPSSITLSNCHQGSPWMCCAQQPPGHDQRILLLIPTHVRSFPASIYKKMLVKERMLDFLSGDELQRAGTPLFSPLFFPDKANTNVPPNKTCPNKEMIWFLNCPLVTWITLLQSQKEKVNQMVAL